MTPRELLIQEIEKGPDALVEEMLIFLRLAKTQTRVNQEPKQSFSDFIEELVSDIPQQVIDVLPKDGAVEHDHYIYGMPKRALREE